MTHDLTPGFNGGAGQSNPQAMFTIPTVVTKNDAGHPVARDVFSRLIEENIIYVTGAQPVGASMSEIITAALLHLYYDKVLANAGGDRDAVHELDEDKRTIKMMINSPGGSVLDGLQIYDTMQLLKSQGCIIETNVTGKAMSMGSVLLVGGSEGHRSAWPSADIMLHQVSSGTGGTVKDQEIQLEESVYINERMKALYRVHTRLTDAEIERIFDRDYYIRGEEAVDLGIVDNVIYPKNVPDVAKMMKDENMRHWSVRNDRLREAPSVAPTDAKAAAAASNDNAAGEGPSAKQAPKPKI